MSDREATARRVAETIVKSTSLCSGEGCWTEECPHEECMDDINHIAAIIERHMGEYPDVGTMLDDDSGWCVCHRRDTESDSGRLIVVIGDACDLDQSGEIILYEMKAQREIMKECAKGQGAIARDEGGQQ